MRYFFFLLLSLTHLSSKGQQEDSSIVRKTFYKNGQPAFEEWRHAGVNTFPFKEKSWYADGTPRSEYYPYRFQSKVWRKNGRLRIEIDERYQCRSWYRNGRLQDELKNDSLYHYRKSGSLHKKYLHGEGCDGPAFVYEYRRNGTLKKSWNAYDGSLTRYDHKEQFRSARMLKRNPYSTDHFSLDGFLEEYWTFRRKPLHARAIAK